RKRFLGMAAGPEERRDVLEGARRLRAGTLGWARVHGGRLGSREVAEGDQLLRELLARLLVGLARGANGEALDFEGLRPRDGRRGGGKPAHGEPRHGPALEARVAREAQEAAER